MSILEYVIRGITQVDEVVDRDTCNVVLAPSGLAHPDLFIKPASAVVPFQHEGRKGTGLRTQGVAKQSQTDAFAMICAQDIEAEQFFRVGVAQVRILLRADLRETSTGGDCDPALAARDHLAPNRPAIGQITLYDLCLGQKTGISLMPGLHMDLRDRLNIIDCSVFDQHDMTLPKNGDFSSGCCPRIHSA